MKNINVWVPGNPEEVSTPVPGERAITGPKRTLIIAGNETDDDSDVSEEEKGDLEESANEMPTEDEQNLRKAALDNKDAEGTPLNEGSFKRDLSGSDLDVPGTDLDDADESIGEEDEENNEYSLGGDNHDDIPEDDF
jgi:hypothetical protein